MTFSEGSAVSKHIRLCERTLSSVERPTRSEDGNDTAKTLCARSYVNDAVLEDNRNILGVRAFDDLAGALR